MHRATPALALGMLLILTACGAPKAQSTTPPSTSSQSQGSAPSSSYGSPPSGSSGTSSGQTSSSGSTSTPSSSSSSSSTQGTSSSGTGSQTSGATTLSLGKATVGGTAETVLTDAKGDTLYYFTKDTSTTVACTGGCASVWPPLLLASGTPTAASGISGKLSVLSGPNGRQVLYNGHPLYTFTGDTKPGQATGQGYGGTWYVATPGLAAASGTSSGGWGY